MTKEQILARKEQLIKERDAVKANLLAYEGAILDCEYWLTQLETTEE